MLDIPLAEIKEEDEVVGKDFARLRQISLRNCPISKWECLEKFRHLPKLNHIKLLGKIPLFEVKITHSLKDFFSQDVDTCALCF